jgi:2-oxoglutarate ferredoxin oxidoreductase subunit alpha
MLRARGIKAGLLRPVTLSPFPAEAFERAAARPSVKKFISVELSKGQMVEDVRLSVNGKKPVGFYGRTGGSVMNDEEVAAYAAASLKE